MKSISLLVCAALMCSYASETNMSKTADSAPVLKKTDRSKDANHTKALLEQKVKEQMEREKKYAREQKFYQGDDYNLSEHEVDPKTLKDIPVIEPDYDFDITDVYRDDI